jgi:nicotinamidase/pyrazinamidase
LIGNLEAMVIELTPGKGDLLLVIDVQNDFCTGGNLAVAGGEDVIPIINRLGESFENVVMTQDWHPAGHSSFASSHESLKPFTEITMPYGSQTLWPDHCIQGSMGAELHSDLNVPHASMIVRKGYRNGIDSYSAFFENDHTTPTGLSGYLRERGFERIYCVGLAMDFCVRFSAVDASKLGFQAVVLEEACRAIDMMGSLAAAREDMADSGVAVK